MTDYRPVIGLEVHCQLATASKLFSAAPCAFGGHPNARVAGVDLGLPGTLPTVNAHAVELAIRAALALEGAVQNHTHFDRKNYFYPDLPKGYQISQLERPYCAGGRVPLGDGRHGALERIHMEEDAGKSMHTERGSLIDLNRAGMPLIEIVGKPDLRTSDDAVAFLENLKQILQYTGVSECDMEKGSLRCDANISMQPTGTTALGTKVEIKNLNSFKMVHRALDYEQRRQTALLAGGGVVIQETRLWNDERGETASLRSKESAPDYRYFPEPDLPPLTIAQAQIDGIAASLPELPAARRRRWQQTYGLPEHDLDVLLADHRLADYFEEVAQLSGEPKLASNWVMSEVLRAAHHDMEHLSVPAPVLAEIIAALQLGTVNRAGAKAVFAHVHEHGGNAAAAVAALGLRQVNDEAELRPIVERVLADHAKAVADYRSGVAKAFHAIKGQVMRSTGGKANPEIVDRLLHAMLDDSFG